jgi:hypothetical protein
MEEYTLFLRIKLLAQQNRVSLDQHSDENVIPFYFSQRQLEFVIFLLQPLPTSSPNAARLVVEVQFCILCVFANLQARNGAA